METLPVDCDARYWRDFLSREEADALLTELLRDYDVSDRRVKMADGSLFEMENGVYMFMDENLTSFEAFPEAWGGRAAWPDSLAGIRGRIREVFGVEFQVARSVHYADGKRGMDFHTDPPAYGPTDAIASLSLGAERPFVLRNLADPSDVHGLTLHHGSLLFMGAHCQDRYEHAVPVCEECREARINLTFRKYRRK